MGSDQTAIEWVFLDRSKWMGTWWVIWGHLGASPKWLSDQDRDDPLEFSRQELNIVQLRVATLDCVDGLPHKY